MHLFPCANPVQLPEGRNAKRDLADLVGQSFSTRFALHSPLWDATYYTNIILHPSDSDSPATRQAALFIKCHHSLGDGQAFVRGLLRYVSSLSPSGDLDTLQYTGGLHNSTKKTPIDGRRSMVSQAAHILSQTLFFIYGTRACLTPTHTGTLIALLTLVKLHLRKRESMARPTRQKQKQLAWTSGASVPLADVKRIKKAFGVTVNDVLVASYAHGLARFLRERDELKDGAFPISLTHTLSLSSRILVRCACAGCRFVLVLCADECQETRGLEHQQPGTRVHLTHTRKHTHAHRR